MAEQQTQAPGVAPVEDRPARDEQRPLAPQPGDLMWVISNRVDNRVVLFERDPAHPGGEAFVGGAGPDYVAMTAEVERLLHSGEIVEIPEPRESRYKPVGITPPSEAEHADVPGERVRLGRAINPELLSEGDAKHFEAQRRKLNLPKEMPLPRGVEVPKAQSEKEKSGR